MVVDAELQLEQMLQNPELKDQWEREKKIKNIRPYALSY